MEKIQVVLAKARETKGTYVYEEDLGEGGKPPKLRTQYIQKWVFGSDPPDKIKVTIEPVHEVKPGAKTTETTARGHLSDVR